MKNKYIKNILTYIIIFAVLCLLTSLIIPSGDEIYTYGFSYNIASGLIPYKDFNMVIGPLYNLIITIPILLFGNHIITFELFHLLFYSLVFTAIYNKYKNKGLFIIFSFLILDNYFMYNDFCIFLIISILLLLDSKLKYKDLIIGLLIGMIICTKHNIGGVIFLIYFFTGKNKISRLFYSSIPCLVILGYLYFNNIIEGYLNFCIFGMGSFLQNLVLGPLSIIILILMIYPIIKDYIKTKNVKDLYILGSFIIIFPIIDYNHISYCIVLFIYFMVDKDLKNYLSFFIKSIVVVMFACTYSYMLVDEKVFVTDNSFYKYRIINKYDYDMSKYYNNFIKTHDGDIYTFGYSSYKVKLSNNIHPGFYDLINNGNMGTESNKYTEDLINNCDNKECYFLFDYSMFPIKINRYSQANTKYRDLIEDKYEFLEKNDYYVIYKSNGE